MPPGAGLRSGLKSFADLDRDPSQYVGANLDAELSPDNSPNPGPNLGPESRSAYCEVPFWSSGQDLNKSLEKPARPLVSRLANV